MPSEPHDTGLRMSVEMRTEIEERREKGEPVGKYIRDAVQARFDAEDAGEWADPTDDESESEEVAEA